MISFLDSIGIMIFSLFAPFIPLVFIAIFISKLQKYSYNYSTIRNHNFDINVNNLFTIKNLINLSYKKIKISLMNDVKITVSHRESFLKRYKYFYYSFIINILFWLFYIAYIIFKISQLHNISSFEKMSLPIIFLFYDICLMWLFFLSPLLKFFNINTLARLGDNFIGEIFSSKGKINNYIMKIVVQIVSVMFCSFFAYASIKAFLKILEMNNWLPDIINMIVFLLVYQYPFLWICSIVLDRLYRLICKRKNVYYIPISHYPQPKEIAKLYFIKNRDIILNIIQNSTYFSLSIYIIIISYASSDKNVLYEAIAALFLFDTYLLRLKDIRKKEIDIKTDTSYIPYLINPTDSDQISGMQLECNADKNP